MLGLSDKFESGPLDSGLEESSICFGNVGVDDDVRCSVWIIG